MAAIMKFFKIWNMCFCCIIIDNFHAKNGKDPAHRFWTVHTFPYFSCKLLMIIDITVVIFNQTMKFYYNIYIYIFPNNRKIRECFYKTKNCYRKVIKTSKKQFKENMLKQIESLKSNNCGDYWKILNKAKIKTQIVIIF